MRTFFLNLLVFSFLLLVSSQGEVFSQKKKEIKLNKIKTTTESITETNAGKEVTYKDTYSSFDKNGNILEEIKYNSDGTIKKKTVTKYDNFKNKIEETEYDGNGNVVKKQQCAYNSKGDKILEEEYDGNNKLTQKTVYIINSKGLRVEKRVYDSNNVLKKSYKITYEM
jgi:hypothetical protein